MIRMSRILVLLTLCIGVASAAPREVEVVKGAVKVKRYQIVGTTEAAVPANASMKGMHDACQAEFGSSARMCTSVEAVLSPSFGKVEMTVPRIARVQPVIASTTTTYHPVSGELFSAVYDATGISLGALHNPNEPLPTLDCRAWFSDASDSAHAQLVIQDNGTTRRPRLFGCASTAFPVACCKLKR